MNSENNPLLSENLQKINDHKGRNLQKAKQAKNDEFYTQISDIEKEMVHYREQFRGKTILCNCDDPEHSNFWKYFTMNFKFLGLQKVITTHFEKEKSSYKLECMGDVDQDGKLLTIKTPLQQNGDFRSLECIDILKSADIVITNPPFSLFREYVAQLTQYGKSFLIVGNHNSVTYKEIFKLIKDGHLWLGISPRSMMFKSPDGALLSVNSSWFTNLNHKKRNHEIILYKKYLGNENLYPKYDNYDAINIDKVKDIPMDYDGVMGVPITFMDKFNPEQFEICGTQRWFYDESLGITNGKSLLNGKETYDRIFIKNRKFASSISTSSLILDIQRSTTLNTKMYNDLITNKTSFARARIDLELSAEEVH
jgi:hypothetical protein